MLQKSVHKNFHVGEIYLQGRWLKDKFSGERLSSNEIYISINSQQQYIRMFFSQKMYKHMLSYF